MNTITGFGAYQSNYYQNTVQEHKEKSNVNDAKKADKTDKSPVQLSSAAKKLLKEIQKKYGDMDIMVGKYESEEEASSYLARGTKSIGVLIDPEELEEMAQDEELKNKNLNLIDEAVGKLNDIKDQLGDKKNDVTHMGVSIGKDGTVSYFAELEKSTAKNNEQQKERIEKSREAKKEQAAQEEKKKKTRVSAESVEELIEKIRDVNWDNIKEEKVAATTNRVDFSV